MLIEALVLGRIVVDVINANPENTIVSWINTMSDIFIKPFEGITSSTLQIDRFEIYLTPIIALLFFMIAAFILSELLKAFNRE
jgi:uncharacterized protein YggT (Ycf19 family)